MSDETKPSYCNSEIVGDNNCDPGNSQTRPIQDQETKPTHETDDQLHEANQKKEILVNSQEPAEDKKTASNEGSLVAGSHILSNRILDEVLNEKKIAILQSPDVIQFLQEKQAKKAKPPKQNSEL